MFLCPECHKPAVDICDECGIFFDRPVFVVDEYSNSKPKNTKGYEKTTHLKEILGLFQGKDGINVPSHVIDLLKANLPSDTDLIDVVLIRSTLRKLKLSKYVECAQSKLFAIACKNPPYIRREIEDKLIRYFKQVIIPFNTHKPTNRKNLLNCDYVVFKLLELMNQHDILPFIPLLRSRIRLKQHDKLWAKICDELGWTFIKTI